MRGEDRVPSSPAETDHAYFVRVGDIPHRVDETLDQGSGDGFTVLEEPGTERGSYAGGGEGFIGEGEFFALGKRGFNGLEEGFFD